MLLELAGILLFTMGAGYTAYVLNRERVALNADRRTVWKRAESLLQTREAETTKRQELNQSFDWSKNLPMIMQFLGGKGLPENIDENEVKQLISNFQNENNGG